MVGSSPKKAKNADHPLYIVMITKAITDLKNRKGASRQAITKYIKANYSVGDNAENCVKMTIKRNVVSGKLIQASGTGASGSFKLPPKASAVARKVPDKKVTKPASKSTPKKKTASKKKVSPKKTKKSTPKKKGTPKKVSAKAATKKRTPAKKVAKVAKKKVTKKGKK